MSTLLLALALATPMPTAARADRPKEPVTCAVSVHALDREGHARPARRVSAGAVPAMVFRGRVSPGRGGRPPLVFDVFNPRGERYQILVATSSSDAARRRGPRGKRARWLGKATLAVAGSSIAWTSMYGRWRVEPRIEGAEWPCGRPKYFTIQP